MGYVNIIVAVPIFDLVMLDVLWKEIFGKFRAGLQSDDLSLYFLLVLKQIFVCFFQQTLWKV